MLTCPDRRRRRGFTLVELLVVVAVMSILMGLIVGGAAQLRRTALCRASHAIVVNLAAAIEEYYEQYRAYPLLIPSDIEDVAASTPFTNQFWDSGANWWKFEAANAAMVYQMLVPRGKGPFLDPGKGTVRLRMPKDSGNQDVEIVVNDVLIRLVTDKFDNPVNVAWVGMVKLKDSSVRHHGYIVREDEEYVITLRSEEEIRFTTDQLVWNSADSLPMELTGLRLWSSGPDGVVNTDDDLDPVTVGR